VSELFKEIGKNDFWFNKGQEATPSKTDRLVLMTVGDDISGHSSHEAWLLISTNQPDDLTVDFSRLSFSQFRTQPTKTHINAIGNKLATSFGGKQNIESQNVISQTLPPPPNAHSDEMSFHPLT